MPNVDLVNCIEFIESHVELHSSLSCFILSFFHLISRMMTHGIICTVNIVVVVMALTLVIMSKMQMPVSPTLLWHLGKLITAKELKIVKLLHPFLI